MFLSLDSWKHEERGGKLELVQVDSRSRGHATRNHALTREQPRVHPITLLASATSWATVSGVYTALAVGVVARRCLPADAGPSTSFLGFAA